MYGYVWISMNILVLYLLIKVKKGTTFITLFGSTHTQIFASVFIICGITLRSIVKERANSQASTISMHGINSSHFHTKSLQANFWLCKIFLPLNITTANWTLHVSCEKKVCSKTIQLWPLFLDCVKLNHSWSKLNHLLGL